MKRRIFGATFWDLIETFFAAQREYYLIFFNYERRVLEHADEQAVSRHQLRLEAEEVSKLLDFLALGQLRNRSLYRTKEISHSLFRRETRTHKFDRYISEIFHDLSILREEQYKVSTFAEEYRQANEMAQYEHLLDEVHEDFPRRVHNILNLFKKALTALESVLRAHNRDPIYLRSIYLFGDDVFANTGYRNGKIDHCWQVFDCGPPEAYLHGARSFAQGGFKSQALTVLEDALEIAQEGPPAGTNCSPQDLAKIEEQCRSLQQLVNARTATELVEMRLFVSPPQVGDDAAPDLDGENWTSADDTAFEDDLSGDQSLALRK